MSSMAFPSWGAGGGGAEAEAVGEGVGVDDDADTFFPEIDLTKWKLTSEEYHQKDEKHHFDFTFETYVKK